MQVEFCSQEGPSPLPEQAEGRGSSELEDAREEAEGEDGVRSGKAVEAGAREGNGGAVVSDRRAGQGCVREVRHDHPPRRRDGLPPQAAGVALPSVRHPPGRLEGIPDIA
jgi:hypothetical protein